MAFNQGMRRLGNPGAPNTDRGAEMPQPGPAAAAAPQGLFNGLRKFGDGARPGFRPGREGRGDGDGGWDGRMSRAEMYDRAPQQAPMPAPRPTAPMPAPAPVAMQPPPTDIPMPVPPGGMQRLPMRRPGIAPMGGPGAAPALQNQQGPMQPGAPRQLGAMSAVRPRQGYRPPQGNPQMSNPYYNPGGNAR